MAQDLSLRRSQVPSEKLTSLEGLDYQPVQITIQEHRADRRGLHYDLRIVTPDRAISFVIPWDNLKKSPGTRGSWIRQPDHVPEYATWEGTIPSGQYGAGTVRVVQQYPGVITSRSDGSLDLSFGSGDDQGRITLSRPKDGNNYFAVVRSLPSDRHWEERPPYKVLPANKSTKGMWASEKLDGALVYMKLTDKGITITSRRKSSKTGGLLIREHHVPWIRDTEIPKKYQGIVLAAELSHPGGFTFVAPLMNSKPERAVALQSQLGRMSAYPHNVLNVNMSYADKMALIEEIRSTLGNPYIKVPRYSRDAEALHQQVTAEGGEGTVLVDPNDPRSPMFKRKNWNNYIGEVVDVLPGQGNYKSLGGAFLVRDAEGNTVRVGGGKNMNLTMRRDMMKNRDNYLGRKIRIKAKGSTGTSLRAGQFDGFAMDDDPLDSFATNETLYSDMLAPKVASLTDIDKLASVVRRYFDAEI